MDLFSTVSLLVQFAPKIKAYIDMGTPLVEELQKTNPHLIPILEQIGSNLFPALKNQIHVVSAAADALFNPNGTVWLQTSLNTLIGTNLKADGSYGNLTKAAVELFQKAHQPEAGPVDGWAGAMTVAVIKMELVKKTP